MELCWDYYNGYSYKNVKGGRSIMGLNEFAKARKLMYKTLLKDEGLYISYQSNIAMLLCDEQNNRVNGTPVDYTVDKSNEMAKRLIKLIFS